MHHFHRLEAFISEFLSDTERLLHSNTVYLSVSNIINVSSRIVLCVTHRGTSKNSGHITVYADSFYSSLTRDTPPYKEGSSEKKKKVVLLTVKIAPCVTT